MKSRIYVEKDKVDEALKHISMEQTEAGVFCNVSVADYKGTKYDPKDTVVITVG